MASVNSAQLVQPFRFVVGDAPTPDPGPGEILVRVEGCGVCGSNLPPWRGAQGTAFPLEPGAPGHEAWGRVEATGSGDRDLVGRRVAMLSYRGFAELDVVARDQLLPLPRELDGVDVPAEPIACAVNVARRAAVRPGDEVVVLGIGFLGGLLLSLLRDARPASIVAVSRRRAARELAERMGADRVLGYDEAWAWVHRHSDGAADVVVEATGAQAPLDLATHLCRVRGRLVVAGYHQNGPRSVDMRLWNWRGLDVINAHERSPETYMEGMRLGLERIADGRLELEPLITHRFPLTDIQRAFELSDRRDDDFLKAVVLP
jgi:NADPH:quinone reductase